MASEDMGCLNKAALCICNELLHPGLGVVQKANIFLFEWSGVHACWVLMCFVKQEIKALSLALTGFSTYFKPRASQVLQRKFRTAQKPHAL